jgi:hypothetical protein
MFTERSVGEFGFLGSNRVRRRHDFVETQHRSPHLTHEAKDDGDFVEKANRREVRR